MKVFRIRDWDRLFETCETRKYRALRYVIVPNKLDGDGYTQLVNHPEGPIHYAAWIGILLVASKCSPRGTLMRGTGDAHTAASLSRITRLPEAAFDGAIPRLLDEIKWMEEVEHEAVISKTAPADVPSCSNLPEDREVLPSLPDKRVPTEPTGIDLKDHLPAPVLGGGNFGKAPTGTAGLRALDRIKAVHIASDAAMESLRNQIEADHPGFLLPGDRGFMQILGASERAIEVGKKPVALFVSIVRDERWGLTSDKQLERAANRLKLYRTMQAEKGIGK